jgi:UDP:flavonoid glycosyltransferase YjiC (YdhE family)
MPSLVSGKASKPLLLFTSFAGDGHTVPLLRVASAIIQRGYEVAFLAIKQYEDKITALGAEYFETVNPFTPELFQQLVQLKMQPLDAANIALTMKAVFWDTMVPRHERLVATLELLKERDPTRQIIVIEDSINSSTIAFKYGRPLPKGFDQYPKTIGICPSPLLVTSVDTAPCPLGLPMDSTPSGRLRNSVIRKLVTEGPNVPLIEARDRALLACGATSVPKHDPFDDFYLNHDALLMLCSPSLEYPISDIPDHVHFMGCLPRQPLRPDLRYPNWWPEMVAARTSGKKVVFVTQGTVSFSPQELIIPTIKALGQRGDVIVIVVMGAPDARLPEEVPVPSNTHVLDYFPYDAVLEHTDVFVSNGGYGGFTHAVINGVPAVFAGMSEEKSEVTARAEFAGFAKNLRTQTPTAEQIREAVDQVLSDRRYKQRAVELKLENEAIDSVARVESHIVRLTE